MKTLSERLAYAMNETGLTKQAWLAKKSGVSQPAISKILSNEVQSSRHCAKIASALGISADWLINGSGSLYGESGSPSMPWGIKTLKLFDANGDTGKTIPWFSEVPAHYRAYIMDRATGLAQVPASSVVVVDPEISPSDKDLVLTIMGGNVSVFRYHTSGDGLGFLSVDDGRVPLAPIRSPESVIGPAMQIFIPNLKA